MKTLKHTLLSVSVLLTATLLYATPSAPAENPKLARQKTILEQLAIAQQQLMKTRLKFLKDYFPLLLQNAPLIGKYDNLESFEQAEGKARAKEVIAQTNEAIERVEKWFAEINAYYQKEYDDGLYQRTVTLEKMHDNFEYEKPNYVHILTGKQIIFLWDTSAHSVPEVIDTALEMAKEVQRTNPYKRILFAAEQLMWTELEPFDKSPLLTEKTDYSVPIVRFAGEPMHPNMESALRYDNLWEQLNGMGIDLLALEDVVADQSWLYSFFKVGNISIPFLGGPEEFRGAAYNRFRATNYGMHQRTTQWDYYIRTVAPYYDVIIVYAGDAHYGLKKSLNMPKEKVIDIFMQKLTLDKEAKFWHQISNETRSDYDDNAVQAGRKGDEETAKTLQDTIYSQLKENGLVSAVHIVIP